jgi:hypothetical protein
MEVLKRAAIEAISGIPDTFLQSHVRWIIGWEEMNRGRMAQAREAARDLMQTGRLLNDPRSAGFGLSLLTWIAIASNSYNEALQYSEEALGGQCYAAGSHACH